MQALKLLKRKGVYPVILLAEVFFIKYGEMVIQHFEPDPVYYLGKYFMFSINKIRMCQYFTLYINYRNTWLII